MPIFEYHCTSCGATSEKIQRQPEEEITCPVCGKKAVRSVSRFAVAGSSTGGCSAPSGAGFT